MDKRNVDGNACDGDVIDGDDEGKGDDVNEYESGQDGRDRTIFLCNLLNNFSNSLNLELLISLYILLLKS